MDDSSRNIVKFIGTITVAALLIMGARYYAESQKTAKPSEAAEQTPISKSPEPVVQELVEEDAKIDPENPAEDIIEEDAELIMGEPSLNLEQGGTPVYTPPVQPDAPAEQ